MPPRLLRSKWDSTDITRRESMSTIDLIASIKRTSKRMTKDQRKQRLIEANIIKDNGEYNPKYFSVKTVKSAKRMGLKSLDK